MKQSSMAKARVTAHVLLVDDNSINQRVAARIVQQLGYKPDLAYNGNRRWTPSTGSRTT